MSINFTELKEKSEKGPWVIAVYTTRNSCSAGGCDIIEGESEIRADGCGGWECRECYPDE